MTARNFEEQREGLVQRLTALVQDDDRLVALWLQGSLADGTADPLSDVDAYIAVRDEDFDAVYGERVAIVEALGDILASMDATTPGLRAVHALLAGPVKLDLFFERASAAANPTRPAVRLLLDKDGVGGRLRTDWQPPVEATARLVKATIWGTRQGAAWPLRLLHRGQWSTLAMTELDLINGQLAQLMLVQADPSLRYRNPFTVHRHLRAEQQAELDTLTDAALAALSTRDLTALRDVHLRIFDALVRAGRAACAALGIAYPLEAAADAAIRDLYVREWPQSLCDEPAPDSTTA